MQISFKDRRLEKQITQPNELQKKYGSLAKKISQRMAELRASNDLSIFGKITGARLHRLSGERTNEYAIHLSANFRLIFKPDYPDVPVREDGGHDLKEIKKIKVLQIQDYH
ncbi:MAG: type II toxin-antitoxin system RelE/ParE family toxin [Bacteroidales bacterium]|nr:type II toxin-antitoxin system RelE/ParE family toxin [Bacteroidales bacterium]